VLSGTLELTSLTIEQYLYLMNNIKLVVEMVKLAVFVTGQCSLCTCNAHRERDLVALHLLQGAQDAAPVGPITARSEHFGAGAKRTQRPMMKTYLFVIVLVVFNIVSHRIINPWI